MRPRWSIVCGLLLAAVFARPAIVLAAESEEAAVKAVLEAQVAADRKQDVESLLANIASDARIDSLVARGKVSKEVFAGAMRQAQMQGYLGRNHEAKVTSIGFPNPE